MSTQTSNPSTDSSVAMIEKYRRAEQLMQGLFSKSMVLNSMIVPTWIGDSDCFWYCRETKRGKEYRLVNAKSKSNTLAFDHEALALSLKESVAQMEVVATDLPIKVTKLSLNPVKVYFSAFDKDWVFSADVNSCHENNILPYEWVVSPDGKHAIYMQDYNLWVRNIENGEQRQLTQDGEDHFAYGAFGSAWGGSPGGDGVKVPQAIWSPDSKKILTVQRDRRKVKELPIVHHVPLDGTSRPKIEFAKLAYPSDDNVETLRIVAIDLDSGRIQEANYRQIPVTRSDWGLIASNLAWWSADSCHAYFVDMERDYKTVRVVEFDTANGEAGPLWKEASETQINLMLNSDERPTFMPLPDTNELIWFSERTGWAHLYLYDLNTGELNTAITQGDWVVRDLVAYDANKREIYIQTSGRTPDRDPYYRDLVRVDIDNGRMTTIASSDHEIWALTQKNFSVDLLVEFGMEINSDACSVSPSGNYAVVNRSRVDEPPVTLLYDRDGHEILEVEVTDVSGLPSNWQWPEPVKMLADDGKTDIYGVVYRPSDFSPDKSYPVIDYAFCTPEYAFAAKGSFASGLLLGIPYLYSMALAELGFIVMQIDGRGVPYRSKAFQDESYGRIASVSFIEDHVAGIRQLAERYSYIDIERVGISSNMAGLGGLGAIEGLTKFPDFYKVGVTACTTDARYVGGQMWAEKFEGLSTADGHCDELAKNLKGNLLIMHGMLDYAIAPACAFQLVEALYKENKDFDLILLPNLTHGMDTYLVRRHWDYVVKYLLGCVPPKHFVLSTPFDAVKMTT